MVVKVGAGLIKTSHRTTNNLKSTKGMTLIEIVIVVAIIAFVATLAIPRLSNRKSQMQATIRKMGVMVREIKNSAKLNRSTYRLVIEIPDSEALDPAPTRYWVEKTPGNVLISEDDEAAELEELRKDAEDREPSKFQIDQRITKEPEELVDGLNIPMVEIANRDDAITDGRAYIYFFPEGYVNQAVIHIKGGESLHWTMALAPVTGKVDVFNKEVTLRELQE